MARKKDIWTEIFPRQMQKIAEQQFILSPRDAIIEGCNAIDVGLVHLLEKRKEKALGSFGGRIQRAPLLGLIGEQDAQLLRAIK